MLNFKEIKKFTLQITMKKRMIMRISGKVLPSYFQWSCFQTVQVAVVFYVQIYC